MQLEQLGIIGLSLAAAAWFFFGLRAIRRRGETFQRWLKEGVGKQGKLGPARWLGPASFGARLELGEAASLFQVVDFVLWLRRRENLPLWAYQALRRQDEYFLIQVKMRRPPEAAFAAVRSGDASAHREAGRRKYVLAGSPLSQGSFAVYGFNHEGKQPLMAQRLFDRLEKAGPTLMCLRVQGEIPHLEVVFKPAVIASSASDKLLRDLNKIVEAAVPL